MRSFEYDVIIVGGGPAGLSAALVLGRCRRSVLLIDDNRPRNWASKSLHGFLTHEGVRPSDFREAARADLRGLEGVETRDDAVLEARRSETGFCVRNAAGRDTSGRTLLLATGVFDELPPIPGVSELFGKSVFQCPYCDGWEARDAPVAIYGRRARGYSMTRALSAWTSDLILCTDDAHGLADRKLSELRDRGIEVQVTPVAEFEGASERLTQTMGLDWNLVLDRLARTLNRCLSSPPSDWETEPLRGLTMARATDQASVPRR